MTRALAIVAWLVASLAACSIKDIDYSGKDCPCPDGYLCNLATQTCTRTLAPGDSGTAMNDGDGAPSDSCLPNPRTKLVYSSVGFPDLAQGWLNGSGQWTLTGGEVTQTNSANALAWLSHAVPTSSGQANYRVVATMRYINSVNGGSVGIGVRVASGFQGSMYTCTYDPLTGELDLIVTQNLADMQLQRRIVPSMDPLGPFTMEVMTSGPMHTCCLRGHDNAIISAVQSTLTAGNAGVVTRDSEGGFVSFLAYE